MELRQHKFDVKSDSQVFKFALFGDTHAFNIQCNEEMILRTVKAILADPFMWWFGMGDFIDGIVRRDKRHDVRTVGTKTNRNMECLDGVVHNAVKKFAEWVKPIKHKCLGLIPGNHEETIRANDGGDVIQQIIDSMGISQKMIIPYTTIEREEKDLGPLSLVELSFKDSSKGYKNVDVCLSHGGKGSATTDAGALAILDKMRRIVEADVYAIGHLHRMVVSHPARICKVGSPQHKKIAKKEQLCVATSSFLETYEQGVSGYGEVALYEPKVLGSAVISIKPFHHNSHHPMGDCTMSLLDAYRLEI